MRHACRSSRNVLELACLVLILSTTFSVRGRAEEESQGQPGRIGVGFATNEGGGLGVILHVWPRIALRPAVDFTHSSHEADDLTRVDAGADALFFLTTRSVRSLSPYLGAGFRYVYASGPGDGGSARSVPIFLGLEYLAHRRVGIFGELGVRAFWGYGTLDTTVFDTFRTSFGVVLFFD